MSWGENEGWGLVGLGGAGVVLGSSWSVQRCLIPRFTHLEQGRSFEHTIWERLQYTHATWTFVRFLSGDRLMLEGMCGVGGAIESPLSPPPNLHTSMSLWVDKHRPRQLSDLHYHTELSERLSALAASSDFPHILFYGPSGAGKKTRIMCVLRELFGPGAEKVRVLFIPRFLLFES